MRDLRKWTFLAIGVVVWTALSARAEPKYVKKASAVETVAATLKASGLPSLEGPWHLIGPFDNGDFDTPHPPEREREVDLKKSYNGLNGEKATWVEFKEMRLGQIVNLKRFKQSDNAACYLYHEFESPEAADIPLSLGSDDSLAVWLNGKPILREGSIRSAAPDQNQVTLHIYRGKNRLLLKVGNSAGDWAVYFAPSLPANFPAAIRQQLTRDFPPATSRPASQSGSPEAAHYRIVTLPVPKDVAMEVGGLVMRPDGKLLACTRRGEVWLVTNPNADNPADVKFSLFASGLHEALGMCLVGKDLYVVQRPEMTKVIDTDGDDVADQFTTFCDKWGCTGDYHEFAFGPARDRQGNFYVSLNVGFGGGHQAKGPWRGWCVKITPKGELIPFATGLRSPNGIAISPEGDVFYSDNQGEWVETNKMQHIREGDWFGHQAGLRYVPLSPFKDKLLDKYPSGMLYDGGKGRERDGFPPHTPPTIWFPYGRMGQSTTEMTWDTTGGKFGPFAGQCLVGDLTHAKIMRVYLEKINGRFQGACFNFRSGFESGVNRLCFGPDASLYVGMTNRGWGSTGGKPWGLQRLVYSGVVPFEIHAMKLTKSGFDLTFTKPLDAAAANRLEAYNLQSFTYNYWSNYGSPEVDRRAEKVQSVTLAKDGRSVSLKVDGLRRGRLYELNLSGIKSTDGDGVLHPEAYYTLNELVK